MCISWCADQMTLRTARCNDKDEGNTSCYASNFMWTYRPVSHTNQLTNQLNNISTALLEKLSRSASHAIPRFYGTRRYISAFTTARYLLLHLARLIPTILCALSYFFKIHFNTIPHIRLWVSQVIFACTLPNQTLHTQHTQPDPTRPTYPTKPYTPYTPNQNLHALHTQSNPTRHIHPSKPYTPNQTLHALHTLHNQPNPTHPTHTSKAYIPYTPNQTQPKPTYPTHPTKHYTPNQTPHALHTLHTQPNPTHPTKPYTPYTPNQALHTLHNQPNPTRPTHPTKPYTPNQTLHVLPPSLLQYTLHPSAPTLIKAV